MSEQDYRLIAVNRAPWWARLLIGERVLLEQILGEVQALNLRLLELEARLK